MSFRGNVFLYAHTIVGHKFCQTNNREKIATFGNKKIYYTSIHVLFHCIAEEENIRRIKKESWVIATVNQILAEIGGEIGRNVNFHVDPSS